MKAISWRMFAICLLAIVSFATTDNIRTASLITLFYHTVQVFMFFLHERIWNSTNWGRTKGLFIQMTGMSGAGKSTLARLVSERLRKKCIQVEVIDGDEYRAGLCSDLGFSKEDRNTNIRRLGFVSKVLARNNVVSIIAAINPYDEIRQEISCMDENVKTVHINCDITTLKKRDPKGLYKRALLPNSNPDKIHNFTGISDPFEPPSNADLTINTNIESVRKSVDCLEKFILESIEMFSPKEK
tara:strand:+ start:388 stop:1113 length:726 start_codon:yes stop_codon:yes gene_type:complete